MHEDRIPFLNFHLIKMYLYNNARLLIEECLTDTGFMKFLRQINKHLQDLLRFRFADVINPHTFAPPNTEQTSTFKRTRNREKLRLLITFRKKICRDKKDYYLCIPLTERVEGKKRDSTPQGENCIE